MITRYEGTDRIVYASADSVYKFPRVDTRDFSRNLFVTYRRLGARGVRKMASYGPDCYGSFQKQLLHGIVANMREQAIARDFPEIVVPTRSFGHGILNRQDRMTIPDVTSAEVVGTFADEIGGRFSPILGHMLEEPSNLGFDPESGILQVRFVDGGSGGMHRLLYKDGQQKGIERALSGLTEIALSRL